MSDLFTPYSIRLRRGAVTRISEDSFSIKVEYQIMYDASVMESGNVEVIWDATTTYDIFANTLKVKLKDKVNALIGLNNMKNDPKIAKKISGMETLINTYLSNGV